MITEITEVKHLIYSSESLSYRSNDLKDEIEARFPGEGVVQRHSPESLAYMLLPLRSVKASKQMHAFIYAENIDELNEVYEFRDLLSGINIILILEKNDDESLNKAAQIDPIMTTFIDEYPHTVIRDLLKLHEEIQEAA